MSVPSLGCFGDPIVTIRIKYLRRWYKNGQLLPLNSAEEPTRFPNSSFTIQKDEQTNDKVIIFSTVSDQDEGDYYCVAQNKAGTVQGNPVSISVG